MAKTREGLGLADVLPFEDTPEIGSVQSVQYHANLKPHSIEISTSAKGSISWAVKIYTNDLQEAINSNPT